ncbi:MAG: TIGR02147 family protein [Chitinispirillaceae bacterium]|nr:TIGR02147 family protein [Chitinispirillaceae bacterium]
MADIFSYTDYRLFIKEHSNDLKKTKSFFSYRYIAQKAGLKSSGFISWVIAGKRTISLKLAHKLTKIFNLGKRETEYFLLLVSHNQATTVEERQHYLDRLLAFRSTRATVVERDRDQYYSRWYYSVIRELVALTPIKDGQAVASLLKPSITRSEAKEALELLCRLNLIRKEENGGYERIDPALTSGPDVDPAIIHAFQVTMMQLAQSAPYRIPKEDRDVSTLTISCNEADLARIRERVRQMRAEITEIACESENADRVFQINTQIFPLSKKISGGEQ